MALGFRYVVIIALLFYVLSALGLTRDPDPVLTRSRLHLRFEQSPQKTVKTVSQQM